jgi:hypothetical protein
MANIEGWIVISWRDVKGKFIIHTHIMKIKEKYLMSGPDLIGGHYFESLLTTLHTNEEVKRHPKLQTYNKFCIKSHGC